MTRKSAGLLAEVPSKSIEYSVPLCDKYEIPSVAPIIGSAIGNIGLVF